MPNVYELINALGVCMHRVDDVMLLKLAFPPFMQMFTDDSAKLKRDTFKLSKEKTLTIKRGNILSIFSSIPDNSSSLTRSILRKKCCSEVQ